MSKQNFRQSRLEPWLDLQAELDNLEVISLTIGSDRAVYILAIVPPSDYREKRTDSSFAKITPSKPNTFVILRCDKQAVTRITLDKQLQNFHYIQPLPNDELLLVCARSSYRGPDDYDANGHSFNLAGAWQRSFLLGDGIQNVQTTRDGRIWVSYFDEGIFGNRGWDTPIGASGLVCWDQWGSKLYEYMPPSGLERMCDCYALNVATAQDTWCYYYTQFPLVHLHKHKVVAAWACPLRGSGGFTLYRDMVLMHGGYGQSKLYHLFELQPNGRMQEQARYTFVNEGGQAFTQQRVAFRGESMVILDGTLCYRIALSDLLGLG